MLEKGGVIICYAFNLICMHQRILKWASKISNDSKQIVAAIKASSGVMLDCRVCVCIYICMGLSQLSGMV